VKNLEGGEGEYNNRFTIINKLQTPYTRVYVFTYRNTFLLLF